MARPRVLIASDDATTAVQMLKALDPRRYRVEHIFDLNEAMLRAELVLAHTLVIHARESSPELARQCAGGSDRLSRVFVSPAPDVEALARELGALFISHPFEIDDFKRVIYRAVSIIHQRRTGTAPEPPEAASQRIVLMMNNPVNAGVISAVVSRELKVDCDVATNAQEAIALLNADVCCIVVEAELLLGSPLGNSLAGELAQRGIAVLSLNSDRWGSVDTAGQVAWDLMPRLRLSLSARDSR